MARDFLSLHTEYVDFIWECWDRGWTPLFELVSPENQVVVFYPETELVLIQVRDSSTGGYLHPDEYLDLAERWGVSVARWSVRRLADLLSLRKRLRDFEGWVVSDSKGLSLMLKVKTEWYLDLHRVVSDNRLPEHLVIKLILTGEIDDVLSGLPESPKKEVVRGIVRKVSRYLGSVVNEVLGVWSRRSEFGSRGEFALEFRGHPYFPVLMKFYDSSKVPEGPVREAIKALIVKRTNSLSRARRFLSELEELGY